MLELSAIAAASVVLMGCAVWLGRAIRADRAERRALRDREARLARQQAERIELAKTYATGMLIMLGKQP